MMYLSDLKNGEKAVVHRVRGSETFHKRITEMGFVKGKTVKVIKNAPLQDPIEYEVMGYLISLRRRDANKIEIATDKNWDSKNVHQYNGLVEGNSQKLTQKKENTNSIEVALVGNPNCGKTTLFNFASKSHERVGNYSGVTVEAKTAQIISEKYKLKITDLPGTYSLTEYSPEELFVRNHLLEKHPDIVVNVVDASNLERNLFLTTQLIDMNIKVIIALNMYDELNEQGVDLDYKTLGQLLGIPIIPTVAVKGEGVQNLIDEIIRVYEDKNPIVRHIHINYGNVIEDAIVKTQQKLRKDRQNVPYASTRYAALKLLEKDSETMANLKNHEEIRELKSTVGNEINNLEKEYGENSDTILIDAKYGFISGALKEVTTLKPNQKQKRDFDYLLTHRIWGFPIFLFFMWLMFQATFTLGSYPMDWIDAGVGYLGELFDKFIPSGALHDLVIDGIIGGVGGVVIFLPNILILFFFISLMEDTGYMARVSFIMDRLMHKIGLHGKSFISLLMGFGCNVPAIMATRTLENRKDRIMTMMITPFMSCSARLPVYVLIISAVFVRHQGLVLLLIYLSGIALAVLTSLLLKKTVFSKQDIPFVMELPPYRIPTLKNTIKHMWYKGSQYLQKMGTVILFASILIWALSYFPRNVKYSSDYDAQIVQVENNTSLSSDEKDEQIDNLELSKTAEHQEQSIIGKMGHFIEPAIRPLGFDWKMGVSILTGLAAKEIVVSSMGVLYHADLDADENSSNLKEKIQAQTYSSGEFKGEKVFTPLVALAFMLFVLIYFPCVAVIAAIRKEANWKWAVFTMVYTTGLAWLVAFGVYQIGSFLSNL